MHGRKPLLLALLLASIAGGMAVNYVFIAHYREVTALTANWTHKGGIALTSASDGPFVATHLQVLADKESQKAVGVIDPPLAIIDSRGATIPAAALKQMKWVDIMG